MKTIILRIGEVIGTGKNRGYPVSLCFDDRKAGWEERPVKSAVIPFALSRPPPPVVPNTKKRMKAVDIRNLVLTESNTTLFDDVGQYLHDLVICGDVAAEWKRLRKLYPKEEPPSEGIRAILEIIPKNLRRLPWELLSQAGLRLSVEEKNCLVRGSGVDFTAKNDGQLVPLRLLVVVGSPNSLGAGTDDELEAIRSCLPLFHGRIDHEFLTGPTKRELLDKFNELRPHIFHFIGHGAGNESDAKLLLETPKGQAWSWTKVDILNDLSGWTGRLMILNACKTAIASEQEGSWSVAEAFVERGWPAVIGMQGDIRGSAAVSFSASLYRSLATGKDIDLALAAARREIYQRDGASLDDRDWFLPAITLKVPPGEVIKLKYGIPDRVHEVEEVVDFRRVKGFIDRAEQRRAISRGIHPEEPGVSPKNLLLVTGESRIGKTWLVRWCLQMAALRGHSVRYVDLAGISTASFLNLLRGIRDASTFSCNPAGQTAFSSFNDLLNRELRPSGDNTPLTLGSDAGFPLPSDRARFAENLVEKIFDSFWTSMVEASKDHVMVVALDHLEGVLPEHFKDFFWPQFVKKVIADRAGNLRLIVVMDENELKTMAPSDITVVHEPILLGTLKPEEYVGMASEFLLHNGRAREDFIDIVLGRARTMKKNNEEGWWPAKLQALLDVVSP